MKKHQTTQKADFEVIDGDLHMDIKQAWPYPVCVVYSREQADLIWPILKRFAESGEIERKTSEPDLKELLNGLRELADKVCNTIRPGEHPEIDAAIESLRQERMLTREQLDRSAKG